ncbi:hypothetical protein DFH27DRAFT_579155 [Peziza echinospora]|nr:hypothetical protein DFH27DRAFT_579155 [Peziza echinospora]
MARTRSTAKGGARAKAVEVERDDGGSSGDDGDEDNDDDDDDEQDDDAVAKNYSDIKAFIRSAESFKGQEFILPPIPIIASFSTTSPSSSPAPVSPARSEKTVRDESHGEEEEEAGQNLSQPEQTPVEEMQSEEHEKSEKNPPPPIQKPPPRTPSPPLPPLPPLLHPPRSLDQILVTTYGYNATPLSPAPRSMATLLARSLIFDPDHHRHLLHLSELPPIEKHTSTLSPSHDYRHPPQSLKSCTSESAFHNLLLSNPITPTGDNYLPLLLAHLLPILRDADTLTFEYEEAFTIYIWSPLIDNAFLHHPTPPTSTARVRVIRGEVPAVCHHEKLGHNSIQNARRYDCIFRASVPGGMEVGVLECKRRDTDLTDWIKIVRVMRDMLASICRRITIASGGGSAGRRWRKVRVWGFLCVGWKLQILEMGCPRGNVCLLAKSEVMDVPRGWRDVGQRLYRIVDVVSEVRERMRRSVALLTGPDPWVGRPLGMNNANVNSVARGSGASTPEGGGGGLEGVITFSLDPIQKKANLKKKTAAATKRGKPSVGRGGGSADVVGSGSRGGRNRGPRKRRRKGGVS